MTKAIIFDLDGVLTETKKLHFDAFNYALDKVGLTPLSLKEHEAEFNGLPTAEKIKLLKQKGFNISDEKVEKIKKIKADYTAHILEKMLDIDMDLVAYFMSIEKRGLKIGVASNAIKSTVVQCITRLGLECYVDHILSNEDVENPKPDPEIYSKMVELMGIQPDEALVFEDNQNGIKSALKAGCEVIIVDNPEETKMRLQKLGFSGEIAEERRKINVVIPMAGDGSRFERAGYTYPKPLVSVGNKPMIEVVYDTLPKSDDWNVLDYTFIIKSVHQAKYNIDTMLEVMSPNRHLISLDMTTDGALQTVLQAREYVDNDNPLIIANSDQYVKLNWDYFEETVLNDSTIDGAILTFDSIHPKFSFARTEEYKGDGERPRVLSVAEKLPNSRNATCGIYYFKKGSDFVKYADQMVEEKNKTMGEYYLAHVYNYFIQDGKKIIAYPVEVMMSLGTPEDLQFFLNSQEYKQYVEEFGL